MTAKFFDIELLEMVLQKQIEAIKVLTAAQVEIAKSKASTELVELEARKEELKQEEIERDLQIERRKLELDRERFLLEKEKQQFYPTATTSATSWYSSGTRSDIGHEAPTTEPTPDVPAPRTPRKEDVMHYLNEMAEDETAYKQLLAALTQQGLLQPLGSNFQIRCRQQDVKFVDDNLSPNGRRQGKGGIRKGISHEAQ